MPLTCICGIIGALAISSFPLTSGFISKSMISQAAADEHLVIVWLFLAAASAGVFLHAGIKFPWFVFFQKDSGLRPPDPPLNMKAAMVLFAFLCIFLGVMPETLYALLPYPVDYAPYTADHVVTMLQLLLFSGLAFFLLLPLMKRTLTISLDVDWFYRRAGAFAARALVDSLARFRTELERALRSVIDVWIKRLFHLHGPQGVMARTWQTGSTVLMVTLVFAVVLVFSYL
jgi:multicomponent Na+:H+ antiporter subunit D